MTISSNLRGQRGSAFSLYQCWKRFHAWVLPDSVCRAQEMLPARDNRGEGTGGRRGSWRKFGAGHWKVEKNPSLSKRNRINNSLTSSPKWETVYLRNSTPAREFLKQLILGAHPKNTNWITFPLTCQKPSSKFISLLTVCLTLQGQNAIHSSGWPISSKCLHHKPHWQHNFTLVPNTLFTCCCRCFLTIFLWPFVVPGCRWKGVLQ